MAAGTVAVVSQNSGSPSNATPQKSVTLSGGSVTVSGGGGGYAYQTIGVIHAPARSVDVTPPTGTIYWNASGSTTVLNWNASDANFPSSSLTYTCSLDGAGAQPCSSPYTLNGLSDGPHSVVWTIYDPAGNSSSATASWNTYATYPQFSNLEGPSAFSTGLEQPFVWYVSNPDGSGLTVTCQLDGGVWQTCPQRAGPYIVRGLIDGDHTFIVKAVSAACGNWSTYTWRWRADTGKPSVSVEPTPYQIGEQVLGHYFWPYFTNKVTAQFDMTVFDPTDSAQNVALACSGPTGADTFVPCTSPVIYAGLTQGLHIVWIKATDPAGNQDIHQFRWVIDTTKPTIDVTKRPAKTTSATSAKINFNASHPPIDGYDVSVSTSCALDGKPFRPCEQTVGYSGLKLGDHLVQIVSTDAAGNTQSATVRWKVVS